MCLHFTMKEILTWFSTWRRITILLQITMIYMIFQFKTAQNLVADHYVRDFLHNFPIWGGAKFRYRALWNIFWNYLLFKAPENVVVVHYERDFGMIFYFEATRNLVAEHYVRDFDITFYFKADQNMVAEHHERDFDMIFHFMLTQNLVEDILSSKQDRFIGPALMRMNKNKFSLILDNFTAFTRKKTRRWKISS